MRLRRWSRPRRIVTAALLPGAARWCGQSLADSVLAAAGSPGVHVWLRHPPDFLNVVQIEDAFLSVNAEVEDQQATFTRTDKSGVHFFPTTRPVVPVEVTSLMGRVHDALVDCAVEVGSMGAVLELRAPTRWTLGGRRRALRVTRWRIERGGHRQVQLSTTDG